MIGMIDVKKLSFKEKKQKPKQENNAPSMWNKCNDLELLLVPPNSEKS